MLDEKKILVFIRNQPLLKKKKKKSTAEPDSAAATMKSVASRDCDSFLPPDFGLLDRPEVRVVDHAVLASLGGGNDPVGRQHGVLLLRSRIILENKQFTEGKRLS